MPDSTESLDHNEDGDEELFANDEDDTPLADMNIDELLPDALDDRPSLDQPPS